MDESYIECRYFPDYRGNIERIEYKWIGKDPKTHISFNTDWIRPGASIGDIIDIGPYKLRVLEFRFTNDAALCIRIDYPFWWWFVFAHRAGRVLDLFYRRVILTAAVWKLADYNPAVIPGWQDLHFIKWIRRNAAH